MLNAFLPVDSTLLGVLVSVAIAGGAGIWAVITSVLAARTAVRTRRAQFYMEFTDRYNSAGMHLSMQGLMALHRSRPDDFARHYIREFHARSPEGMQLDIFRRSINRYYVNIADMAANGLLDRKMASMLTNFQGLNIYYQVVMPMNRAKYANNEKNEQVFRTL